MPGTKIRGDHEVKLLMHRPIRIWVANRHGELLRDEWCGSSATCVATYIGRANLKRDVAWSEARRSLNLTFKYRAPVEGALSDK